MFHRYLQILSFVLMGLGITAAKAQPTATDSVLLGAIVVDNDTFPMSYMQNVYITDKLPRRYVRTRRKYDRLKYNVQKVYPYAIIAAEVLKDVDVTLLQYADDKKARKAYLKTIEKELNKRFKGELENLTITQGQILVKLINRQTGKNCFSIIKELKGGFSAVIWQSLALLFSNNLKKEYDPYDRDKDIEDVVVELEADNYHQYQVYRQQARLSMSKKSQSP